MGDVASGLGDVAGGIGGLAGGIVGGIVNPLTGALTAKNPYMNEIEKQQFADQIAQSQQAYGNVTNQQQGLANALLAQSQGAGPNPAQAMLNQSTDQNAKQAAGMIAGQKGINPALAQRQALMAGTQANQQAAGQGAIMNAQQQLGAQGHLASLYGTMGGQQLQNQATLQQGLANQNSLYANAGNAQANRQANVQGSFINAAGAAAGKAQGGVIGGEANVPGDSPANDTVKTMLSPGEIVIPRTKAKDPDKAKEFIDHISKSNQKESDDGKGYGKILEAHRKLKKHMDELEKQIKAGG